MRSKFQGVTDTLEDNMSKAMAGLGEKEWKTKIQKFEYLENEKSFLDEIKNIF